LKKEDMDKIEHYIKGLSDDIEKKHVESLFSKGEDNITQFGTLHPGDIKYADLSGPNGDMIPDGIIDGNDEIALGYPVIPLLTFGFTTIVEWKGFDLNLFFQGSGMVSRDIGTFETVAFVNNKSNCDYVYFSGQNLVTFSKQKFKDPETADYGSRESTVYAIMKSFAFGANITF
jgi:hypothetical protein